MGFAEFEEKEFEKPLYNQLENGECDVWTPGQCFEANIGIDYSGNISSFEFWNRFGGFIPKGVILNDYNMSYIFKKMKKRRMLPDFSLNLFIQAKRPYIHSGQSRASVYDVKHYSFEINQRQQKILEKLDQKLKHRALLVYASPIFATYDELYKYTKDRNIISNTSFPKVSILSGHENWYYCDTNGGIAHSEPEEIEIENIFSLIEILKKEQCYNQDMKYDQNLDFLSRNIVGVLDENFREDAQVKFFFSQFKEMKRIYEYQKNKLDSFDYMAIVNYLTIIIFCDVFNLDWFLL